VNKTTVKISFGVVLYYNLYYHYHAKFLILLLVFYYLLFVVSHVTFLMQRLSDTSVDLRMCVQLAVFNLSFIVIITIVRFLSEKKIIMLIFS